MEAVGNMETKVAACASIRSYLYLHIECTYNDMLSMYPATSQMTLTVICFHHVVNGTTVIYKLHEKSQQLSKADEMCVMELEDPRQTTSNS